MNKGRINKRLKNLKNVKVIIEIAKIDTIKKIANSNNIKSLHYEMAEISQQIINYYKSLKKWSNKLNTKPKTQKTLWIFITLASKLIKISYAKYERILEKNINKTNDAVIAIGDPAIDCVSKKKYNLLAKFNDLRNTELKLSSLIMHVINNRKFTNIAIISHSTKSKDNFYKIYPFENVKYDHLKMKKMKFFYSLSDTMGQISFNYIKNTIGGIYQESYRNFYAERLAKHEDSLKSIDKKLYELKMFLVKNDRKEETDEMIQVIQSIRRR